MTWITKVDTRCGICRRTVDGEMRERARWAVEPLIVCEECLREADQCWSLSRLPVGAAA
jgi:hypothetical protein